MKRTLLILLTIFCTLYSCSCKVDNNYPDINDFADATNSELEPYVEEARNSVELYYTAVISYKDDFPDLSIRISESCKSYLELKFKYEKKNDKEYLEGEYELIDYNIINNRLICNFAANILFRYVDETTTSFFSDSVQVIIENPKYPQIVDWYNGDPSSFDSIIRGHNLNLANERNLLENQDIEKILDKGSQLIE